MKAVVFYEFGANAPMEAVMAVFPRHKVLLNAFASRGELLAVGPFADPVKDGSMGVFKDRTAAETFVQQDPFVLEGLVGKYTIKDWNESLLG